MKHELAPDRSVIVTKCCNGMPFCPIPNLFSLDKFRFFAGFFSFLNWLLPFVSYWNATSLSQSIIISSTFAASVLTATLHDVLVTFCSSYKKISIYEYVLPILQANLPCRWISHKIWLQPNSHSLCLKRVKNTFGKFSLVAFLTKFTTYAAVRIFFNQQFVTKNSFVTLIPKLIKSKFNSKSRKSQNSTSNFKFMFSTKFILKNFSFVNF